MATHSSIVAWRIPWTEEPGGYSPWSLRVGHDRATKHSAGRGPLTQDDWRPLRVTGYRHGTQGQRALGTCPVLWGNGKRLDSEIEAECSPAAIGRRTPEILPAHSQKPGKDKEGSSHSLQEERDPPDN